MRVSLPLSVRPIPLSQIPLSSLRLPTPPKPLPNLQSTSPTLDKLLNRLSNPSPRPSTSLNELPSDGRGLGGYSLRKGTRAGEVPGNLRVEEWVEKRREFEGVGKKHRDLLRRLRREA